MRNVRFSSTSFWLVFRQLILFFFFVFCLSRLVYPTSVPAIPFCSFCYISIPPLVHTTSVSSRLYSLRGVYGASRYKYMQTLRNVIRLFIPICVAQGRAGWRRAAGNNLRLVNEKSYTFTTQEWVTMVECGIIIILCIIIILYVLLFLPNEQIRYVPEKKLSTKYGSW